MAAPALPYGQQRWRLERLANGNLEFSLRRNPFLLRNILPLVVRDQKGDESCLFQAFCATSETDAYRQCAINEVPSNRIQFNTYKFVDQYEADIGMSLAEERRRIVDLKEKMTEDREARAVRIFREQGVPATSDKWEGEKRIRLKDHQKVCNVDFETIASYIVEGRCVAGSIRANSSLRTLGADEIYSFILEAGKPVGTHMVVFVGFGIEGDFSTGRPYLEFLDSDGPGFADGGFGKAYFHTSVYTHWMHLLTVGEMPPVELEGEAVVEAIFDAFEEIEEEDDASDNEVDG